MNNKALALAAALPVWILALMGAFEVQASDGVFAILGLFMIASVTWASVRLYKVKD